MKTIIFLALIISFSVYSKDLLIKKGKFEFDSLIKTFKVKGVEYKSKRTPKPLFINKNYISIYQLGMGHYNKTNDIPDYAKFYILNTETKQKEIIKLPLKEFFNKNQNLFYNNAVVKIYPHNRKVIKPMIKIVYYDKNKSSYLLEEYNSQKINGERVRFYNTIYLQWNHKTNEIWGINLNKNNTHNPAKIIGFNNDKLYYFITESQKETNLDLNCIDLKTHKLIQLLNYKSKARPKGIYIDRVLPYKNFDRFFFLEYSAKKENKPKGYLVYKDNGKFRVKTTNIPLTSYGYNLSEDNKYIYIASNQEGKLLKLDAQTLKTLKIKKIKKGVHKMALFDNDKKLILFYNNESLKRERGIAVYNAKSLKLIKYYSYKNFVKSKKYYAFKIDLLKNYRIFIFPIDQEDKDSIKNTFYIYQY